MLERRLELFESSQIAAGGRLPLLVLRSALDHFHLLSATFMRLMNGSVDVSMFWGWIAVILSVRSVIV